MQRTRIRVVGLVLAASAVLGFGIVRVVEDRGMYLPQVPWIVDVAIAAIAVVVLVSGLAVRAYQQGRRPTLDGLRAARTLILAKAATFTGALLAGWYLAQAAVAAGDWGIEARQDKAIAAGTAVVVALALSGVGMLVERWCQIPPPGADASSGESVGTPDVGSPA